MITPRLLPELLRVAHTVRRRHEQTCELYGLTFQQFNVLRILAGEARRSGDGLPVMTIRARLLEPGPGITRFVRQLSTVGLVATIENAADRRSQIVGLTPAGHAKLAELETPIRQLSEELLAPYSAEDRELFRGLLLRFS